MAEIQEELQLKAAFPDCGSMTLACIPAGAQ
jgi:hypothetical protein